MVLTGWTHCPFLKSLILMWFRIKLCQLHEGKIWLVHLHIPLVQCPACKCLSHARHVLSASCALTQVKLPVPYMGGSASF